MIGGRGIEVFRGLLAIRRIAGPAGIVLSAILLLSGSTALRTAASERYDAARKEHRASLERLLAARGLAEREGEVRKALEILRSRTGRKEALREVFEPFVAPEGNVETRDVSYKVSPAGRGLDAYEIRFSTAGRYPDLARFLAGIETGAPLAVVESVEIKRAVGRPDAAADRSGVAAGVTVRVPVR